MPKVHRTNIQFDMNANACKSETSCTIENNKSYSSEHKIFGSFCDTTCVTGKIGNTYSFETSDITVIFCMEYFSFSCYALFPL